MFEVTLCFLLNKISTAGALSLIAADTPVKAPSNSPERGGKAASHCAGVAADSRSADENS